MPTNVRYATIEWILARLVNSSGDVQEKAFRGRLKHLKRLGIPLGSSPGKGVKVWYADDHLYQWAFCLELAEFGIDPTVVVDFVREHWQSDIAKKFEKALPPDDSGNDLFFYAYPSLMSNSWSSAERFKHGHVRQAELVRVIHRSQRTIIINLSLLKNNLMNLRVLADSSIGSQGEP